MNVFSSVAVRAEGAAQSVDDAGEQSSTSSVLQEQQVYCQFCKYLLEDALLGDCRVTRWIGSGTFGDVYEAQQLPPLNRRVAVKVMAVEHVADGRVAELFEREVQAIAALDHPNILSVLRVGTTAEGRPYLVMKFAAHGSLQKFCSSPLPPYSVLPTSVQKSQTHEQKPLPANTPVLELPPDKHDSNDNTNKAEIVASSITAQDTLSTEIEITDVPTSSEQDNKGKTTVLTPQQLLPYLEGAAAALQYAHDHGIIHLDVKPANLLLDSADRLLLADFGVSVLLEGYTHASLHGYVGTPLYTAPEQWLEQPRAASDQYALAVTCYQLLTGRPPFTGNLFAIMHGHINTPPPPSVQPLIPAEVEAVILRALAKEPTGRYKDMQTFAHAYRAALESSANSQTDAYEQRYVTEALASEVESIPDGPEGKQTSVSSLAPDKQEESSKEVVQILSQPITVADAATREKFKSGREAELAGEKIHPRKKHVWRNALLLLLALLFVISSGLGITRLASPCTLGICPAMALSTHDIQFTNSNFQRITIGNSGTADLHWSISATSKVGWLKLSPQDGIVHAGKTGYFTIASDATGLPNGTYTRDVQVIGQGVPVQPVQNITVTMQVQTGLSAVKVQANLTAFSLTQGRLQPASQKITITNKSGQTLSWFVNYSENTWLVVTPNEGMLNDGKSVVLTVTANTLNLSPNTYVTRMTLIGTLPNHPEQTVFGSYELRLNVARVPQPASSPPVTQVTPTPTQPTFQFPNYSAQPAPQTGAPAILRSGQGMVWDDHDNLVLVFGGIDDKGNVLNDLWAYNPGTKSWSQLNASTLSSGAASTCGTVPAPRTNAAMVWDSLDQQVFLYGGVDANNRYLADLWSYTPATNSWTLIRCTGNGPGARSASAVWDGHEMLVLGGINKYGLLSDFWSYTPTVGSNGKWQRLPDTLMSPRVYQTLVWDSTDGRLYVFGGLDASGIQQDDFWSYSTSTGWVQITPNSTDHPLGRQQAMGAWDSKNNVLILMGGWEDGQKVPFWGFWVYDPRQNAWGLLLLNLVNTNSPHIPGRTAASMVWDATDQRIYIYAGAGNGKTGSSLNDLWMIS